jgi:hypothetical protein
MRNQPLFEMSGLWHIFHSCFIYMAGLGSQAAYIC